MASVAPPWLHGILASAWLASRDTSGRRTKEEVEKKRGHGDIGAVEAPRGRRAFMMVTAEKGNARLSGYEPTACAM
jgi:coenzyme F420-reducing hydrogenase alpha subunit